ncbi:MAG: sulfatase [Bryobacteraceae bacterium]|nr:sulfatase [Bryobacteraceae bacterium]
MLRRRELFTGSLLAAVTSCARPARPNILLVIADDQSWRDAGAYGAKHVATPAFDRLAREGALFLNSFSACPSCTPSRSAVLMGRHVWQQQEAGVLYGTMPPAIPLYPHLLAGAGYHTGFTGKGWAPGDWKAMGATRNPCGKEYNSRKHAQAVRPGIEPADYAVNFAQFLDEKPSGQPFCFWLGSKEPHRIYDEGSGMRLGKKLVDAQVPEWLPDVEAVRSDLLDYYLEIEWYDQQLARTLKLLEDRGLLEDTLIVATSDNGMPFPRAKVSLYDGGVHMPLAMRWGRNIRPGTVIDSLVSHVDFAPTFLEAAGVPAPTGIAGRSLLPLLRGEPGLDHVFAAMERHTMCRPNGGTYPMRSLRTKEFLYIRNFAPDRWPTGGDFLSSNNTRHGDIDGAPSKDALFDPATVRRFPQQVNLCLGKRPPEELYELASDPGQVRNIAGESRYAPTLAELRGRLESYLRQTGDPRMDGQDPWQNYVYHQTSGYGASFNATLPAAEREAARTKVHRPE